MKKTFSGFVILAVLVLATVCVAAPSTKAKIFVPGTPSSIPIIIAAKELGDVKVVHSLPQAHAGFIRGDADFVLTGLSVALKFFDQGQPVRIVTSHVSSLSYLVYNKERVKKLDSFSDLNGKKIWFPFPGSPIEEVSHYLASKEGLKLGGDIQAGYGDFQSSLQLLKSGKIDAAVLPEPFVSLGLKNSEIVGLGVGLADLYKKYNEHSYPQVAFVVKEDWLIRNSDRVEAFYKALASAIELCRNHPKKAVAATKQYFSLSEEVLLKALTRTEFSMLAGEKLQAAVFSYYETIGKDLDVKHRELFEINN